MLDVASTTKKYHDKEKILIVLEVLPQHISNSNGMYPIIKKKFSIYFDFIPLSIRITLFSGHEKNVTMSNVCYF